MEGMTALVLDSCAATGTVGLVRNNEVLAELTFACPRGRGGAIFESLRAILSGKPAFDRVVVGTGPGSYNGIRAAIAAAWGIAKARNARLCGVPSILALAQGEYFAVGDARASQFYFAHVRDGAFVSGPELLAHDLLLARLNPDLPVLVPSPLDFLPAAQVAFSSASLLAAVSLSWPDAQILPEPLYLKPPNITAPRPRS